MVQNFRDVIDLWESADVLAAEIGATRAQVRKWKQRDSIPADWWLRVVAAAKLKFEAELSTDTFAGFAARTPEHVQAVAE